jgi:hypothetical protein
MGKLINFKDISNWEELFDMTHDYLTFLVEEKKLQPELIIKVTQHILNDSGYDYSYDDVEMEYFKCM